MEVCVSMSRQPVSFSDYTSGGMGGSGVFGESPAVRALFLVPWPPSPTL